MLRKEYVTQMNDRNESWILQVGEDPTELLEKPVMWKYNLIIAGPVKYNSGQSPPEMLHVTFYSIKFTNLRIHHRFENIIINY